MNVPDDIPREVENHLRGLLDDDQFITSAWNVMAGYHDLRGMELLQVSKSEAKDKLKHIESAIAKLKAAVHLHSDLFPVPPELARDIRHMENHYNNYKLELAQVMGRSTRNKSLLWLAGSLLNVFSTYGVSDRKITGLIFSFAQTVSPEDEPSAPSLSAIEKAVKKRKP